MKEWHFWMESQEQSHILQQDSTVTQTMDCEWRFTRWNKKMHFNR
jgi:hypothetical protein